jgi:hypothetical protein
MSNAALPGTRLAFNWVVALPLPVVAGTNNVVTNTADGARKFYRLFAP